MTPGRRLHYAEMLRRAHDEHALILAALGSVVRSGGRRVSQLTIDLQREELVDISVALRAAREEPEEYGLCDECGAEIDTAILDVAPWTRRCQRHARPVPVLQ
jgi:hypothetical protein